MNSKAHSTLDPDPGSAVQEAPVPMANWGPNQAIRKIRELRNGYAFLVVENPVPLLMVLELFKPDHFAYRFLRIEVEDEAEDSATWVHVSGSDGVKAYLRSVLLLHDEAEESQPLVKTPSG